MKRVNFVVLFACFIGISGAFSVLFGAWLAHAGVNYSQAIQFRLETALNYQFIHTLALFACLVWFQQQQSNSKLIALFLFSTGILFFSGTLYVKTFFDGSLIGNFTPFGGIILALAWLQLVVAGIRK